MKPETWQAPPGDRIPNNPRFPVLIYRGVEVSGADAARALFAEHGWGGSWVASVRVLPAVPGACAAAAPRARAAC